MKYGLILSLLISLPCLGQTKATGEAKTAGLCSPAVTGSKNTFQITCKIVNEQGQKMLGILNKILANQLDPKMVMEKLDEILKAVNPNMPAKTYSCGGDWVITSHEPGLTLNPGGDTSAYMEMFRLYNSRQFADLIKTCLAQIRSTPEWLTPRLFCAMAYFYTGDKAKAKEMLADFDAKTGPAYTSDGCGQMSDFLHKALQ